MSIWYQNLLQATDHVNDPVLPEEKTGVVYRLPCSDCPAMHLRGQSGRTLIHPLKEHKRALTTASPMNSALTEHAMNTWAWNQ